jgi:probable HAF family extracellular repeat protein
MTRLVFSPVPAIAALTACLETTRPEPQESPRASVNAPVVSMVDLGTLGLSSEAIDMNEKGDVVGLSTLQGGSIRHAFLWTKQDGMTDLGTLGGDFSTARAINNGGTVVGASLLADSRLGQRLFLWTPRDGMRDVHSQVGTDFFPLDMNDLGQVVGRGRAVSGQQHAMIWSEREGLRDLGTLPGLTFSSALATNNQGVVVGESRDDTNQFVRAFRWTPDDGMMDLGSLGGERGSLAFDVNERGDVVGRSQTTAGEVHAFLWTESRGMIDLGILAAPPTGTDISRAFGTNDHGDVVGSSLNASGVRHAFLWTEQGGMIDLGSFHDYSEAKTINNAGLIAGVSRVLDGTARAVVWEVR